MDDGEGGDEGIAEGAAVDVEECVGGGLEGVGGGGSEVVDVEGVEGGERGVGDGEVGGVEWVGGGGGGGHIIRDMVERFCFMF